MLGLSVWKKSKLHHNPQVKGRIRSCRFLLNFTCTDDGLFKVRLGFFPRSNNSFSLLRKLRVLNPSFRLWCKFD